MARLNIYLPDHLAERARAARLNMSSLTQTAVEAELARRAGVEWLSRAAELPELPIDHDEVMAAVREEFEGGHA